MTGESRNGTSLPDSDCVKAEVAKLIPKQHQGLGMSVEVSKPKLTTTSSGVRNRAKGYDVWLCLGEDRVRVGGRALSTTLDDWLVKDSLGKYGKTGPLSQMVKAAASALVRRHRAGA